MNVVYILMYNNVKIGEHYPEDVQDPGVDLLGHVLGPVAGLHHEVGTLHLAGELHAHVLRHVEGSGHPQAEVG